MLTNCHRSLVDADYLVIGSGVAGLSFALAAAKHGTVLIVTKRELTDTATSWAQGGVAAVLSPEDSFERHVQDTLVAGAGMCHRRVVDLTVEEGPAAMKWLLDLGAEFTTEENGELALGREGGHTERRVAYAGDTTGREVQRTLTEQVREHPNIEVLEWHMGIDLLTLSRYGKPDRCVGAYVLDEKAGTVKTCMAHATVLATGGAGKAYLYTSNPDVATGDGVAMAYRAGAEVANMEFYQFHPTCLFHPLAKNFLISETLRGEGAVLRNATSGEAFMQQHHDMADLAPRDIVARAIDYEMKRGGYEHVMLDITHKDAAFVKQRFPNIYESCLSWGIDITQQPIPVVPAAHYMCGGVTSDLHGRSSLPGLWVIGEVSCTGLHGANRLASNSLLEGLVFGRRAAIKLETQIGELRTKFVPEIKEWEVGEAVPSDEAVVVSHNWDEVRRLMWNYVGIVRSNSRLDRAQRRVKLLDQEIHEYYWKHLVTRDLLELRNIALIAELIIKSAASRQESRGLHCTIDYEATAEDWAQDTVIKRGVEPRLRGH